MRDNIFIGYESGCNTFTGGSNLFIGYQSGFNNTSGYYNIFIGYQAGFAFSGNNIGSNNIIIGTNISLPDATANAINLGGVIFATDTYSNTSGDPSIVPANGKVGINIVAPAYTLDVSGSINFTDTLYQNGVPFSAGSFLRNKTHASATDTITVNESIFNPSSLTILSSSIFVVDTDADYYVLGDLINSGSLVVNGTLKVGGTLYNSGSISGTGTIE